MQTSSQYDLLSGAGQPQAHASSTRNRSLAAGALGVVTLLVVIVGATRFSSDADRGVGGAALSAMALSAITPTSAIDVAPNTDGSRTRLRVTNGCKKDPLWLANFAFQAPFFKQDIKLPAGESHDFAIPDEGLAATRFWAKWGCDEIGGNCKVGQSGGPGESCNAVGCAPPVDSKFEATFGCMTSPDKCARNPSLPSEALGPTDWWDVSQVDGWTLPYKVEIAGDCPGAPPSIDCSQLSLKSCPETESFGGSVGTLSLRLKDVGGSGDTVGCYSPCAKLTYAQWGQGKGFTPESKEAQDYCCPTPPITPEQCSSGPVVETSFVKAVHTLCPSVYAYAYDDGVGLAQCPAGVRYDVTFYCPE